jgi:4'-phosphopantetheinyl transferase
MRFFDLQTRAAARSRVSLSPGEVHVWRSPLKLNPELVKAMEIVLSPDELIRANRFHFQRDRANYVSARAMLRRILASYLNTPPAGLRFRYGVYGKPELDELRFNVSHSGALALFAVSRDWTVGVDVERIRADFDWRGVARMVFSTGDIDSEEFLDSEEFFRRWTRKEAYLKALGVGWSASPQANGDWSIEDLSTGEGYAAALAVNGRGHRLACWEHDPEISYATDGY